MAWQLIYTSAPRLLDAGRTGFGTVARHRAVNGLLVAAVERLSQFARLPGFDPRRIIYSHRIMTVGAGQFHVLSCIRDAGSDYTGRTNHIAHHLIAETREIHSLTGAGVTPADVLLSMRWCTQWQEAPRFLGPAEEITLADLRAQPSAAWNMLTGKAGNARLPSAPAMQRGCYLILPPEADGRQLFRESLEWVGLQAWQTTFTTSLEPNDDVADFRWIGVAATSPLRPNPGNAARPVLDLTRPASLPESPPLPGPVATAVSAPMPEPDAGSHSPEVAAQPQRSQALPAPDIARQRGRSAESFGDWSPQPVRVRRTSSALLIVAISAAGVLLLLGGAATFWIVKEKPRRDAMHQAVETARSVDELWARHHLKLPATKQWLKEKSDAGLIKEHQDALDTIHAALLDPAKPSTVKRPNANDPNNEFGRLLNDFEAWHTAQQRGISGDWKIQAPTAMREEAEQALTNLDAAWNKVAQHFETPPQHLDLREELLKQATERLKATIPPAGSADDWLALLNLLRDSKETVPWLKTWQKVAPLLETKARLNEEGRNSLRALAQEKDLPGWLMQRTKERLDQDDRSMASTPPAAAAAPQPNPDTAAQAPSVSPDSPTATHPIYIAIETSAQPLSEAVAKLPALEEPPDRHLWVGEANSEAKNLERWKPYSNGVYRKNPGASLSLEFKGGVLKVPSSDRSWRILGRTADETKVFFEVVLVPAAKAPAEVLRFNPGLTFRPRRQGDVLTLGSEGAAFLKRLQIDSAQMSLRLQRNSDAQRRYRVTMVNQQAVVEPEMADDRAREFTRLLETKNKEKKVLEDGIAQDKKLKAALPPRGHDTAAKQKDYDFSIGTKEGKIDELKKEIQQIKEEMIRFQSETVGSIPPGAYTLIAILSAPPEYNQRLCEVQIEASPAAVPPAAPTPTPAAAALTPAQPSKP